MSWIIVGNSVIKANRKIISVPVPVSAEVTNADPDKVVITFDQALNETSVSATTAFALAGKTISNVVIVGANVILTVTVAYIGTETITIDYTQPALNPLISSIGGAKVLSFSGQSVNNNILDNDTAAYLTGLVTPLSIGQIDLLDILVRDLKTGLGISLLADFFDILYIFANETQEVALRNLAKRSFDATPNGSPTFTALEGFAGGVGKYINSNFKPNSDGVSFSLNSASIGHYSRTDANGLLVDCGVVDGTKPAFINTRYTGFYGKLNVNDTTGRYIYITPMPNSLGLFIMTRWGAGADDHIAYKNKTSITGFTGITGSEAVPDIDFYFLAMNINGTDTYHSSRQLSLGFVGKYINTAQRDIIVDAFEAYMDANGKGVI